MDHWIEHGTYMTNALNRQTGARKIIDTCLGLSSGQELLILFDETTLEVANLMIEAAFDLQVSSTGVYVPSFVQTQIGKKESLPLPMESAIRNTTGIVTCLTDAQNCLPFRKKIFKVGPFKTLLERSPDFLGTISERCKFCVIHHLLT